LASLASNAVGDHDEERRMAALFDLSCAAILALAGEGVLAGKKTFADLDDYELRELLAKYGCAKESLQSAVLDGYYNSIFANIDGKRGREYQNTGAGTALFALLRISLAYRGAYVWKMQAGMGDTIFAPYYEVLRKRGVKFHYFHEVTRLELSADGKRVQRIHLTRQVDIKGGGEYRPLVKVRDL